MRRLIVALLSLTTSVAAQDAFPPEEFAARRAKVYAAIGENGVALVAGASSPVGYTKFRQTNEFHYLCGIEVPHAYLLLDGRTKSATAFLPHRNEARERSEGKVYSAEDADEVKSRFGVESVAAVERLAETLAGFARTAPQRTIWTPFAPAEGGVTSRDAAIRYVADVASDPWDGRPSREGQFIGLIRARFPHFEIRDLTPVLDALRLIKSARELAVIRKATRASSDAILAAMRATKPGMREYELDAIAKYVFYRSGARADAYYSLIATGSNAIYPHYHAGSGVLKDGELLLMDYAPDIDYYISDVTRMWPVNGKFNAWQRELYTFYVDCYRAILNRIRPGATPAEIKAEAASDMEAVLARTKFSKPLYAQAARKFVDDYRTGPPRLGHWIGMAAHDVGFDSGPLRAGMAFTIEPALRVPEEKIYIRLEDVIFIGEDKAEIVTANLPMDIPTIQNLTGSHLHFSLSPQGVANKGQPGK
jgi:Xaa-Pro aminopeptidase